MRRPFLLPAYAIAFWLGISTASATPPPILALPPPRTAAVSLVSPPAPAAKSPLQGVLDAARSPVARHLVVSALKPVPRAAVRWLGQKIAGSRGAAEKIEHLVDAELKAMPATALAALAAPVIRPNLFQRIHPDQKERLSKAFLRVLDSAGEASPGKFEAVVANLRLTEHLIPGRFKLDALHVKADFQQRVAENRIARGALHAFDERLSDMGMQKGDGSLQVLLDGKAAFADLHQTMMTAVESAKTTGKAGFVMLSTFALHSDQTGRDFASDLVALRSAGFKVHVLYDGFGSKMSDGAWSDPKFYEGLKAAGVDLTVVKPGALLLHNSHKKPIQIGYYDADGAPKLVEYNGDMNIGDPYRVDWHGSMTRIEGPATKHTLGALVDQLKANGAAITPTAENWYRKFAEAQPVKPGMSPIWTVNHRGPVDLYNKVVILSTIDVAPKGGHIFIEQPYIDDPDLFASLERAAQDGVHVHMLVPLHNDENGVAVATRLEFKKLLAAGVEVYQFNGRRFKNPEGFSHLKRIVVLDANGEGLISQDGSSNSDAQSFYHNDELIHLLTTASIPDSQVRQQKSQTIKQIVRDVFVADIQSSARVTEADEPKAGLSTTLNTLLDQWKVTGWLE